MKSKEPTLCDNRCIIYSLLNDKCFYWGYLETIQKDALKYSKIKTLFTGDQRTCDNLCNSLNLITHLSQAQIYLFISQLQISIQ